jgi:subtilisin family serine protease
MKRLSIYALTMATALVTAAPALAADPSADSGPAASYIVQFTPGSDRAAEVANAKALGMKVTYEYTKVLNGMAVLANKGQLTALEKNPNVRLIEADGIATISDTQTPATWGIDRIDQQSGTSGSYTYPSTAGQGVTAYIIDTGINRSHQEFTGRTLPGYDAVTVGGSASDCNGHGTHVAGTVAGTTYGVAKKATVVPVRVLDCAGSGAWSGVIAGVDWVANNARMPAVANMSLGGGVVSSLNTAVANAVASGIPFAVAAGNETTDACTKSPASTPTAITVGSTTSTDARSSFSNFGTCVDIFAPGSSITSAWYTSSSAINTISGTSMASPHVAGAAALYLGINPAASPKAVADALIAQAVKGVVTSAGTGSPNLLLNIGALAPVESIAAPTVTAVTNTSGAIGATVTIDGTYLSSPTAVRFNGVKATTVTVVSSTQIKATVPAGATTGPVSVTTAAGTGVGPTFTVLAPPAAPTGLRTVSVTRTSGTVAWTVPAGPVTGLEIRRGTAGGWTPLSASTTQFTFVGLARNTSYTWQVRASNGQGPGPVAQATFRTAR